MNGFISMCVPRSPMLLRTVGKSWRKRLGHSREVKVVGGIKIWVRRKEDLVKKPKGKRMGQREKGREREAPEHSPSGKN